MQTWLATIHSFTFPAVVLRLALSAGVGALIGYGRSKKKRAAGLRTHMLVSLGAALSMLIGLYHQTMIQTAWAPIVEIVGVKFDASRYAAQVVSGIGFLAAGSIITVEHQQKEGLTTATGLFVAGCLGIASGAGFYAAALLGGVLALLTLEFMPQEEQSFKRRIRAITLSVDFYEMADLGIITAAIEERGGIIFDLDVERTKGDGKEKFPSAIITIKMSKDKASHSGMLSAIAKLPCVNAVQELIA